MVQTKKLGTQKTHALESGASETLRVVPVQKRFRVVAASKGTWTDFAGSAINLHLEGNWVPLRVSPVSTQKRRLPTMLSGWTLHAVYTLRGLALLNKKAG